MTGAPGIENYDANVRYSSFAVYAGPVFADRFSRTGGPPGPSELTRGQQPGRAMQHRAEPADKR